MKFKPHQRLLINSKTKQIMHWTPQLDDHPDMVPYDQNAGDVQVVKKSRQRIVRDHNGEEIKILTHGEADIALKEIFNKGYNQVTVKEMVKHISDNFNVELVNSAKIELASILVHYHKAASVNVTPALGSVSPEIADIKPDDAPIAPGEDGNTAVDGLKPEFGDTDPVEKTNDDEPTLGDLKNKSKKKG